MDSTSALPYRFRESAFRRYEKLIEYIVSSHPQVITINPRLDNLSSVTYSCRLRDAMRSLLENKWTTTISYPRFVEIYESIVVSERASGLLNIGTRETLKSLNTHNIFIPEMTQETTERSITVQNKEQKDFLINLSHLRFLQPSLFVHGFTADEVEAYQREYDVAIDTDIDGKTHILI